MSQVYIPFKGKLYKQKEPQDFSNAHWLHFLDFVIIFIGRDERDKEAFICNKKTIDIAEEFMKIPNHPFQEFLYRIDRFSDTHTPRDFYVRFQTLVRMLLTHLKKNPSSVSSEMRTLIEKYPERLGWCLKQYEVVVLNNGEETLERNTDSPDGKLKLPSIQEKFQNSLLNLADVMETISSSFTKTELKELSTNDRIAALSKLSYIFDIAKKGKVGSVTNINFNAPTKDLEKQMLEMTKKRKQ